MHSRAHACRAVFVVVYTWQMHPMKFYVSLPEVSACTSQRGEGLQNQLQAIREQKADTAGKAPQSLPPPPVVRPGPAPPPGAHGAPASLPPPPAARPPPVSPLPPPPSQVCNHASWLASMQCLDLQSSFCSHSFHTRLCTWSR